MSLERWPWQFQHNLCRGRLRNFVPCDLSTIFISVFKKNVLKRLYPASESDDSVSTDNESAQSHDPALKSAHSSRPRLYTAASAPTVDEDEDHVISNVAADKQHPTSEGSHAISTECVTNRSDAHFPLNVFRDI